MSVESLILLALFVLLPLIERLLLAARRRQQQAAPERPEADVELPPFMLPEERPQPVAMPPPRPPEASARAKPVAPASRLRAPRPPVVTARARPVSAGSPYRRGLRRAVVMAAVLGPCRALSPYDGPG